MKEGIFNEENILAIKKCIDHNLNMKTTNHKQQCINGVRQYRLRLWAFVLVGFIISLQIF
jgi:hypothetical protein